MDTTIIPIIYVIINISHTVIGIACGLLADKIGKQRVLIIEYSVFAVSAVLMVVLTVYSL